jgi:hypothetical protein
MIRLRSLSEVVHVAAPDRLRIAVLLDHLNAFSGGYEAQLRDALHAKPASSSSMTN